MESLIFKLNVLAAIGVVLFIWGLIQMNKEDKERRKGSGFIKVVIGVGIIMIGGLLSPSCEDKYEAGLISHAEYLECERDLEEYLNERPYYN